jgi:hypothetical protein
MKTPAFLTDALGSVKRIGGGAGSKLAGLSGVARRAGSALSRGLRRLIPRVEPQVLRAAGLVVGAVSMLAVIGVLIGVLIAGTGSRRDSGDSASNPAVPGNRATGSGSSISELAVPQSGPALAELLLIPGAGEWPWPLALEPKARYTEADAAAVRPDLGAVDVTELTRRRKAELEAIFGAVD